MRCEALNKRPQAAKSLALPRQAKRTLLDESNMKRAEQFAWAGLAGLLVIAILLITGGIMYQFTAFWAGAMLAGGQARSSGWSHGA